MPIFEFTCSQCQHQFDVIISNSEKYKVHCPDCGSKEVQQKLSVFATPKPSLNSTAPVPSSSCCAGCSKAPGCGMGL